MGFGFLFCLVMCGLVSLLHTFLHHQSCVRRGCGHEDGMTFRLSLYRKFRRVSVLSAVFCLPLRLSIGTWRLLACREEVLRVEHLAFVLPILDFFFVFTVFAFLSF